MNAYAIIIKKLLRAIIAIASLLFLLFFVLPFILVYGLVIWLLNLIFPGKFSRPATHWHYVHSMRQRWSANRPSEEEVVDVYTETSHSEVSPTQERDRAVKLLKQGTQRWKAEAEDVETLDEKAGKSTN